jgi:superfamily II DNA or RNA helicase
MPQIDISEFIGASSISQGNAFLAHYPNSDSTIMHLSPELKERVFHQWNGCLNFSLINHDSEQNSFFLRQPQITALFKILAHLTDHVVQEGTVVMPTGTGKTETMLAAICGLPAKKTLVIVPTDSLRQQTFKKFLGLGKLRELNAIKPKTLNPVVALLAGGISSPAELELLKMANVIVTTPQSLKRIPASIRDDLYSDCTHLFVDEAHHIKAPTWSDVKKSFLGKPIIQFTATPFREDRQRVSSKIIYNFPMSEAQKLNIFRNINFKSVYEIDEIIGDNRIAEEAVNQLRIDISKGYDHILMARCNTRKRATEIFEIYQTRYQDLNPVLIHSGVTGKNAKLADILRKKHKIVVCVNMLGEGFDLPELKVCALHDIHKSLAITLQFAGRFVRDRPDLGDPTFVANVCDQEVEETLRDLYTEDPDWNKSLKKISESEIAKEVELQELVSSSITTGMDVVVENLNPALSALVYRTNNVSFNIDISKIPLDKSEELVYSLFAHNIGLIILVTKIETKTKWAIQSDLAQPEWRLVIIYHDASQNLLFIHDSSKSGTRKRIAEYFDPNGRLLTGDQVFKCFGNIERLVLQNAGLNKGRRGPLRYVMYTGIDIESAINDLAQNSSYKSNLFGKGYKSGERISIGCSYKGRIWSMDSASISDWTKWCQSVAKDLNDPSVDPNKILEKVLRTKLISEIPDLIPLAIDWPDWIYENINAAVFLDSNGVDSPIDEAEINLIGYSRGVIDFCVSFKNKKAKYRYSVGNDSYSIDWLEGDDIYITIRQLRTGLTEYLKDEESPSVYFEDGSKLIENLHIVRPPNFHIPQIDMKLLDRIAWRVNICNESQGKDKKQDSIQYQYIQKLKQEDHWIVFDDDSSYEIADIVTFKESGGCIYVDFYHLKFSGEDKAGSRVGDFYEVCGQVIKSCKWVGEFEKIIDQLKKREKSRLREGGVSRIEVGSYADFDRLKQHGRRLEKKYRFFIIQPGLKVDTVTPDVLAILGSTDLYVRETSGNSLQVIGS